MGNPFRLVLIGLLILTVTRLVLAGAHELQEDEAYYFMWSERPALSYYSKGPGIAATMWLGTAIFGDNELGVRFFSPILALFTSLLLYRMARSMFDDRVAAWAVVMLNVTPIFTAGSMLMTIDPLSIFFWVASMFCFWRALHKASKWTVYWPLTGLCIGLGMIAKYTNAMQLLSIVIILSSAKRWRVQFARPGFYIMLVVAALCTTPILMWNAQNGWITFTHLKERGSLDEATGIQITEFFAFLGAHFGTYSPIIFFGLLWALVVCVIRYRKDKGVFFLLAFSLPIILMYFTLSFREAGEQNWTAPGFVSAGILLALAFEKLTLPVVWKSRLRATGIGLAAAISLLIMQTDLARYVGISWPYEVKRTNEAETVVDELFATDEGLLKNVGDPSQRMRGWRQTSRFIDQLVREYREDTGGEELFLIANRWQCAAAIGFYLPEDCPIIRPTPAHPKLHTVHTMKWENQFSFWPRYDQVEKVSVDTDPETGEAVILEDSPFIGKKALFISDRPGNKPPPGVLNAFSEWELISVAEIIREAPPGSPRRVRTLKVFACSGFRPLKL